MKLSKTMQAKLDELVNAPYADYGTYGMDMMTQTYFHMNSKLVHGMGTGLREDGTITTVADTKTLKALETRGLIEIVKIGGDCSDRVKLLQHENTNQPLFETHNLTEVTVYLVNKYAKSEEYREGKHNGNHAVEDGNVENIQRYFDGKVRAAISRVLNKKTGEEIYNAAVRG